MKKPIKMLQPKNHLKNFQHDKKVVSHFATGKVKGGAGKVRGGTIGIVL